MLAFLGNLFVMLFWVFPPSKVGRFFSCVGSKFDADHLHNLGMAKKYGLGCHTFVKRVTIIWARQISFISIEPKNPKMEHAPQSAFYEGITLLSAHFWRKVTRTRSNKKRGTALIFHTFFPHTKGRPVEFWVIFGSCNGCYTNLPNCKKWAILFY